MLICFFFFLHLHLQNLYYSSQHTSHRRCFLEEGQDYGPLPNVVAIDPGVKNVWTAARYNEDTDSWVSSADAELRILFCQSQTINHDGDRNR